MVSITWIAPYLLHAHKCGNEDPHRLRVAHGSEESSASASGGNPSAPTAEKNGHRACDDGETGESPLSGDFRPVAETQSIDPACAALR